MRYRHGTIGQEVLSINRPVRRPGGGRGCLRRPGQAGEWIQAWWYLLFGRDRSAPSIAYTSARREGKLHFLWQKLRNLHFVCPVGVTSPGGAWYAGTCKSFSPAQKEADKMEHMAWKGRVKPGCKAEYQRRHNEIWPEMVAAVKEAGICNYS